MQQLTTQFDLYPPPPIHSLDCCLLDPPSLSLPPLQHYYSFGQKLPIHKDYFSQLQENQTKTIEGIKEKMGQMPKKDLILELRKFNKSILLKCNDILLEAGFQKSKLQELQNQLEIMVQYFYQITAIIKKQVNLPENMEKILELQNQQLMECNQIMENTFQEVQQILKQE